MQRSIIGICFFLLFFFPERPSDNGSLFIFLNYTQFCCGKDKEKNGREFKKVEWLIKRMDECPKNIGGRVVTLWQTMDERTF